MKADLKVLRPFLSVEEMAELLGISPHTIYAKTSRSNRGNTAVSLPPWIKVGKLIRFPVEDYEKWLSEQTRYTSE